jgi:hypothetical protein
MSGGLRDRLISFGRWIRCRCSQCVTGLGSLLRRLHRPRTGVSKMPESESSDELKYYVITLGIVVAVPGRIVQLQSDSHPSHCARLRLIVGGETH